MSTYLIVFSIPGGFSAGFYNTVGTKEGWIPTDFISSR